MRLTGWVKLSTVTITQRRHDDSSKNLETQNDQKIRVAIEA